MGKRDGEVQCRWGDRVLGREIVSHFWSYWNETNRSDYFSWREVSWSLPLDAKRARYEEGQFPQLWEWQVNQMGQWLNVEFLWRRLRLCKKIHGILQARILEWAATSSSRGSSRPRGRTRVSWVCPMDRQDVYLRATWKALCSHWQTCLSPALKPGNLASSLTSSHSFLWPLRSPLLSF